jgi:hypothetical protein
VAQKSDKNRQIEPRGLTDIHVGFLQGETQSLLTRSYQKRIAEPARTRSSHVCLSPVVPAFAEPDS